MKKIMMGHLDLSAEGELVFTPSNSDGEASKPNTHPRL